MRATWTATDETGGHFARPGEAYGDERVADRAVAFTSPDGDVLVVQGSAGQIVDWTRRLHLNALRAADRGDEATLWLELHPRVYDPEAAEGETGTERVVDLYGVSISAVPTDRGLLIHLNTDELLSVHGPLHVEVDDLDAGTFRDEPDVIDLDAVVAELALLGIPAIVEQTGGGTATVYAGEPHDDGGDGAERYPVAAGPGHFTGPGWTRGRAYREEFSVGVNDDGLTDSHYPPAGATAADIARMIGHVLRGDPPVTAAHGIPTVPPYGPVAARGGTDEPRRPRRQGRGVPVMVGCTDHDSPQWREGLAGPTRRPDFSRCRSAAGRRHSRRRRRGRRGAGTDIRRQPVECMYSNRALFQGWRPGLLLGQRLSVAASPEDVREAVGEGERLLVAGGGECLQQMTKRGQSVGVA